jgi:hypothetical protein
MREIGKNGYGNGTYLKSDMFLTQAFLSLGKKGTAPVTSWASQSMLILFLGKRDFAKKADKKGGNKKYRLLNGNNLSLTYKELEACGISQKSATRGFDELLAKGFISVVDQGGMYDKHKAVYALSENYVLWEPGRVFETRGRDVHRGFQKPKEKSSHPLGGDTHTDPGACVPG